MFDPNDPEDDRRLIRGKAATLKHFGFEALYSVPACYTRNGGIHIGRYQYGGPNTSWRTVKIVVPELWPCGTRFRAWGFSVNKRVTNGDLFSLAPMIDASGVPWLGFYDKNNSWLYKHVRTSSLASAQVA
jgi:hypothetical protein